MDDNISVNETVNYYEKDEVDSNETIDFNDEDEDSNEITEDIEMRKNPGENFRGNSNIYAQKKNVAEGMMDIALLSANANQLRFVLTYDTKSLLFYVCLFLIVLSLALQIFVGIALILKKTSSNKSRLIRTNQCQILGIFTITVVNVLIAAFTTTGTYLKTETQ